MEGELWSGVIQGGLGTASLMALIIWAGKGGNIWVWARELHASEKERLKDQKEHQAELTRMEKTCNTHLKERDEWKDIALDALGVAERVTHRGLGSRASDRGDDGQ